MLLLGSGDYVCDKCLLHGFSLCLGINVLEATDVQVPSLHEEAVAIPSPLTLSGLLVPHPVEHCKVDFEARTG